MGFCWLDASGVDGVEQTVSELETRRFRGGTLLRSVVYLPYPAAQINGR